MDRRSRSSEHTPLPTSDFDEDNDISSMSEYSGDDESHRGAVMASVATMPRSLNGTQSDVAPSIQGNIQALPSIPPHNSRDISDQATLGPSPNAHFHPGMNPEPTPIKSRNLLRQARTNGWPWELSALFVCLTSLMAIILILYSYEGHSLSSLPHNVSINAIIAIFSAAMKAALSVPVAEAISQAKWDWFHNQGRRLVDMEVYDQASRGPWGALRMLASVRWRHFSSLGAIIVVLALAIDPMLQQMISYQQGQRELNQVATLPVRLGYNSASGNGIEDALMRNAVSSGLLGDSPDNVKGYCPSTNCTWPPYQSLAVCHLCHNITISYDMLSPEPDNLNCPVPRSRSGPKDSICMNANVTPTAKPLHNLGLTIVDGVQILEEDSNDFSGRECVLYWCVSTYRAFVQDNNTLVESHYSLPSNESRPGVSFPNESSGNSSSLTIGKSRFWVDIERAEITSRMVPQLLSIPDGTWSLFSTSRFPIDDIFNKIARAMTAQLRRDFNPSQQNVFTSANGTATITEYTLHIRWWWVTLPVILITSTLVLQLATMVSVGYGQTAVWKSSTLALLFHGLGIRDGLFPQGIDDLTTMENIAEQMTVRLGHTDRGWDICQEPPRSV